MRTPLIAALTTGALALSLRLASAGAQEAIPASEAENSNLWAPAIAGGGLFYSAASPFEPAGGGSVTVNCLLVG